MNKTFIGAALAFVVMMGMVFTQVNAQTPTPTNSPRMSPSPTASPTIPDSPPATGRG